MKKISTFCGRAFPCFRTCLLVSSFLGRFLVSSRSKSTLPLDQPWFLTRVCATLQALHVTFATLSVLGSFILERCEMPTHTASVSDITLPGSSIASVEPDYGPFSVTLILEDGQIFVQPTWPSINIQLLRRQVATSLVRPPETFFFVCHGSVLGLERRLSDHPVITSTTRILLSFRYYGLWIPWAFATW
jgi:hypothetical protein